MVAASRGNPRRAGELRPICNLRTILTDLARLGSVAPATGRKRASGAPISKLDLPGGRNRLTAGSGGRISKTPGAKR